MNMGKLARKHQGPEASEGTRARTRTLSESTNRYLVVCVGGENKPVVVLTFKTCNRGRGKFHISLIFKGLIMEK